MSAYLIEGISGTGKTTVSEELQRRGFTTIDADEAFGYFGDPITGKPFATISPDAFWLWDEKKLTSSFLNAQRKDVFVCGGAMNQEAFLHLFATVFTLHVDDATMTRRLAERTNNDFGKHPDELAKMLAWNKGTLKYARERGTVLIDAAKPIGEVVEDILWHVAEVQD